MPSYSSDTALKRVQYDPAVDGSVVATAFFETTITNDDDPTDVAVKPWQLANFPLPADLAAQIEQLATAALNAQ